MREPSGPNGTTSCLVSRSPRPADEADDLVHAVEQVEQEMGGEPRRIYHLAIPLGVRRDGGDARGDRSRRAGARHRREAVRHRPGLGRGAQRVAARGVRRGRRLPHRPLPRQRVDREHPRAALRQRPLRTHLEPGPCRPRPDRRAGDADSQGIRADRRVSRHGRDASLPGARLHRHGAAPLPRRPCATRPQGVRLDEASRSVERREGQYEGYRDEEGVDPESETETFVALEVEIDNWRWAACRSSCVPGSRWPRAAR